MILLRSKIYSVVDVVPGGGIKRAKGISRDGCHGTFLSQNETSNDNSSLETSHDKYSYVSKARLIGVGR